MRNPVLLLLVAFTALTSFDALAIESLRVTRADGSAIHYYRQAPEGTATYPILLVLQGSECRSPFKAAQGTATALLPRGIARVDIEKYGVTATTTGCPREYLEHNVISQRVLDILRVMQELRRADSRWNRQLWIAGGSEGALVAALVAGLIPETSRLVLLASGGGLTMAENMRRITAQEMRARGESEAAILAEIGAMNRTFDEMRANPVSTKTWAGATNTYRWWASVLDLLPLHSLVDLDFPILMFHGTSDAAVVIDDSRLTAARFAELGKSNLLYREFPGLDHHWDDAAGVSHAAEVVGAVLDWLPASP